MTRRIVLLAAMLVGVALVTTKAESKAPQESVEQARTEVRKMASQTLATLYRQQPAAQRAVEQAAGHAVFSNLGMKILVAGGGKGQGLAVDRSGRETFTRMVEVQAGLGFGAKKFRQVWVFETDAAFRHFVDTGFELGGQATLAAKPGGHGGEMAGAMSVSPGVWVYQMTSKGLAAELTVKGTRYYKDKDLN